MSFSNVLRRTIGLNNFEKSYDSLLDFRITIVVNILKWKGQWPSSKHVLAMLIIPFRHVLFLMIILRCLYESLLGSEVDKLLHLVIELMNSSSKKEAQSEDVIPGILSKIFISIWWSWAILNNKWKAC